MDTFESFKSSREKIDPSSRRMSEHQWKQAYAANLASRERVSGINKKRRIKKEIAKPGSHAPSNLSELGLLRHTVRNQSAYADLRLIVNYLSWIAIIMVILATIISLFYYTSSTASIVVILKSILQVVAIVVLRLLAQVFFDIPDIALYRTLRASKSKQVDS